MIKVEKLYVRLGGSEILKGIDANFSHKHIVLGPNGSGKTTLFRAMAGLIPYEGCIEIDGHPLEKLRGAVGLLATNITEIYHLAPVKALDLLHLFSDITGSNTEDTLKLLEDLGVKRDLLAKRKLWELSAGTKKAFTTALALSSGSRHVILDEPFEQLDPAKKVRFYLTFSYSPRVEDKAIWQGAIVIPAEVRSQLGLKKSSTLTLRIEGKKIVIEPLEELPQDVFIEAEEDIVDRALAEAKESSDKVKQLLRDLGVE